MVGCDGWWGLVRLVRCGGGWVLRVVVMGGGGGDPHLHHESEEGPTFRVG